MKKIVIPFLFFYTLLLTTGAFADPKAKDEEAKREAMRKKIEARKLDLNGTKWEVTVNPQGGTKGTLNGTDVLKFQDGKFLSENFSKLGFAATNYTITVPDVGPAYWETMQSSEKGFITFWRGEWEGGTMSGVISRQFPEGKNEDYYFTSSSRTKIPPSSAEEAVAAKAKEGGIEASSSPAPLAGVPPATTVLVSGPKTEPKTNPVPAAQKASPSGKTSKKGGGFMNYWLSSHQANQQ